MRFIQTLLPLVLVATAFGQDVRYNFASGTNFAKFKTYRWVQIKGTDQPDQITDQQIKAAFDAELAGKGLSKVDTEQADLLIGYLVSLGSEKQVTTFDSGWGYGPGWRGYGYGGGGMSTSTTSTIVIGQLDLDMYDAGEKSLVWRGVGSKTLDTKAKPEKRAKNLRKAAAKMLKNYPPGAKS